ncbi:MAG: amidohydrolase/deacetylase family metallohydrolase [Bryobacterales bacterium]|nr:amidohydrolase/deacetylase family metallohydrolase [Bryobacterales bacterium]
MKRRSFLSSALAATALAQAPQGQNRPQRRFDLLIKNGEVRDPGRSVKRKADVAIQDGKIAAVEDSIAADRAYEVIDAKGLLVTPGLVDLHTHVFYGAAFGLHADPIAARSGVTTWVDAGTFSHDMTLGFRKFTVEPSKARIFGFVYTYQNNRNVAADPIKFAKSTMKQTGEAVVNNRDIMIGVKVQVGFNMSGKYSFDIFKIARDICDTFQIPMMAHISFAPPETEEIMPLMRAGDVVTHCYNGHTLGIVEKEAARLKPGVKEARDRGVIFDLGHGLGSFNFAAAKRALDAGFVCDTISTDIYPPNVNGPVFDLPTTMMKMMYLGMSFDDALLRVTANPARIVNSQMVRVPKLGSLEVGAPGDVALLGIEEGQFTLVDSQRNTVTTDKRVVARATICRGKRMHVVA